MQRVNANPGGRLPGVFLVAVLLSATVGCHDGPLYGLKVANPYYSLHQWQQDELLGPTDHVRRAELTKLVKAMPTLPPERQQRWHTHLEAIYEHDASPEMRRLAIQAAAASSVSGASELIEKGLKDDNLKVRLAACEALGSRGDEDSARLLAETAGSTSDTDVRNAALAALASHRGPIAVDALRAALDSRDPATRALAIGSLKGVTGKDYGNDPQTWIAALDGKSVSEPTPQLADRIRNLWR